MGRSCPRSRLGNFLEHSYGIARSRRHSSIHPELANTEVFLFRVLSHQHDVRHCDAFPKTPEIRTVNVAELLSTRDFSESERNLLGQISDNGEQAVQSFRLFTPSRYTVRLNPTVTIDAIITPNDHDEVYSYLLAWTNRFHEVDISLVGVDDEPIALANPDSGKWTGRNATAEEDDDMVDSEEVSYRDESSEYGASDSESDEGD